MCQELYVCDSACDWCLRLEEQHCYVKFPAYSLLFQKILEEINNADTGAPCSQQHLKKVPRVNKNNSNTTSCSEFSVFLKPFLENWDWALQHKTQNKDLGHLQ